MSTLDRSLLLRIEALEQALERLRKVDVPQQTPTSYTPTYVGGTSAGSTTYAADGQVGYWTKIGRLVLFQGRIQWTAATGTGDARISLPPFTPTSTTNLNAAIAIDTNNVTFAAGTPQGLIQPGLDYFLMRSPATNAASTVVQVEAAGIVSFGGFYITT